MTTATKPRTEKRLHGNATGWKKLLIEAEELRGQSGVSAHRRATILTKLFDDADFRAERNLANDDAVEGVFNELLEDICLGFYEVRAMLGEFPDVEQWADGKLSTLYDKAREQIDSSRREDDDSRPAVTRSRITKADFERLAGEKQDLEARLRFVDQQHTKSLQEIEQLRLENAELKGRISELERIANRTGKAA
jgi:hypothetical protein